VGTFRGESFKTNQGDQDWLEFFALVSSAFAYVEDSPPTPRHTHLSPLEVYKSLKELETKLDVVEQISGLSVAADAIHTRGAGGYYNLIILDKTDRTVSIVSYSREELNRASAKYAELEARADPSKDLVLVSAGRLKSLRQAYPNYFVDVRDFIEKVRILIEEASRVV
jgi:hypothetical protein